MKKIVKVLAVVVLLLFIGAAYAEEKGGAKPAGPSVDVTVRSSRHEGFVRVVFEGTDESFIRNASVMPVKGQIAVQFPSPPKIKGALDIEASLQGKTYIMKPSEPFTLKVLRLTAPPRLSIDIMTAAKEEGLKPAAPEAAARKEESRKSVVPEKTPKKEERKAQTEASPVEVFPNVKIVLDPGHGGYDFGIVSGEVREKDVSLVIARDIEGALMKKNRLASLTRKSDQFLSITDRAASAGQKPLDIFLSIHLSLSGNFVLYTFPLESVSPDASAVELYSSMSRQRRFADRSKALAESIGKAVKAEFNSEIVLRDMNLPLLGLIGAPAVLMEVPATMVYDKATRARLVQAVMKGVASYGVR